MIFGEEMITIDSEKEGQQLLNTLLRIFNCFVARFQNNTFVFPFDMGKLKHEDEIIPIHEWVYGLNEALRLRPACWFDSWPESMPEDFEEELMTALSVVQGIMFKF